jgi:hypothetical protein
MANDTITINKRQSNNHQVKLAICHALAQVGGAGRHRREGGAGAAWEEGAGQHRREGAEQCGRKGPQRQQGD